MLDVGDIFTPELFFEILDKYDARYVGQRDENGNRVTPLVGYVGRYKDRNGEELQYVGDEYFNMRKIEEDPELLNYFAEMLEIKVARNSPSSIDVVCGAPEGGRALSRAFADI